MDLRMKKLIVIFFCTFYFSNAFAKYSKIIDGQITNIQSAPYIVSFQYRSTGSFFCAGSIISNQHIITVAHCMHNIVYDVTDVIIKAGISTLSETRGNSYFISKIDIHPEYYETFTGTRENLNDIAIVTVIGTISFNQRRNQIDLPTENVVANSYADLYGWGTNVYPGGHYSNNLQTARVQILNATYCQDTFPYKVLDDCICTKDISSRALSGDSGGPVSQDGKLIGVIGYGTPWIIETPDIHINVFKHLHFIHYVIDN